MEEGACRPGRRAFGRGVWLVPLAAAVALAIAGLAGATGTFVDRWADDDVRVFTYNVNSDSIFENSTDRAKFFRILDATQPDVVALQEIYDYSAAQVAVLLNGFAPLGGGQGWNVYKRSSNILASPYPFLLTTGSGGHADVLVDLPDDDYSWDFFVLNDHLPCCDNEMGRQLEADAIVGWLQNAREDTGFFDSFTLPPDTPMAVVGDFNIVRSGQPLTTLLTGDRRFSGPDSPPDWDGTPLADARPLHNGVGPEQYTWRNDAGSFAPGVLDYVLYTDSVLQTANRFVLNTREMSPQELAATGLQSNDVVLAPFLNRFDHLPVVVDFRLQAEPVPGDFNGDAVVDTADYELWRETFGQSGRGLAADGDGDQIVSAADYTIWRDALAEAGAATAAPEPHASALPLLAFAFRWRRHKTRHGRKRHC